MEDNIVNRPAFEFIPSRPMFHSVRDLIQWVILIFCVIFLKFKILYLGKI